MTTNFAYAYYAANIPADQELAVPITASSIRVCRPRPSMTIYRRKHIRKLVQMVAKAVGADPHGRLADWGEEILWRVMQKKAEAAA